MARLILKAGRERSLLRRHPWIFSGAVQRVEGDPRWGDTIEVRASTGAFQGWGAYSPASQIVARVWDFNEATRIGVDFFRERLQRAIETRDAFVSAGATHAVRLVHGESDGLPGIVVDRYANTVVIQLSSAGGYRWRDALV